MNTVLSASIRLVVSKTEKIWKQIWKKLEKIFRSELQTFDRLFFQIQKSGNFFKITISESAVNLHNAEISVRSFMT